MQTIKCTTQRALRNFLRDFQPLRYQSDRRSTAERQWPVRWLIPAEILLGKNPFHGSQGAFLDRICRHRKPLAKLRQAVAGGDSVFLLISKRDTWPSATQQRWLREILPGLRLVAQFPTNPSPAGRGRV